MDEQLVGWFRQIHLFAGLTEEQAQQLLQYCEPLHFRAGDIILRQGEWDTHLYLVHRGHVALWVEREDQGPLGVGMCTPRDYFNIEAAYWGGQSSVNARALTTVVVYRMPREALRLLEEMDPLGWKLVEMVARARRVGRQRRPTWMTPKELLLLYERADWWAALPHMVGPVVMALVATGVLLSRLLLPMFEVLTAIGLGLWFLALLWAVYISIEWRNDIAALTSQRAVYIHHIILIHQARQEIPLYMVVAHERFASFWERMVNIGHVVVRAEGVELHLPYVPYPALWQRVLTDYTRRHRETRYREEHEFVARALRERLGLVPPEEEEPEAVPEFDLALPEAAGAQAGLWQRLTRWFSLSRWFALRHEEGNIITYRRHWIFLLRNLAVISLPLFGVSTGLALLVPHVPWASMRLVALLAFLAALASVLWIIAEWYNDYYQITDTQVIEYRARLFLFVTAEARHVAPLVEIRSIDYETPGILARLLNFGNVRIYTGGEEPLVFSQVFNPKQVQSDIFARIGRLRRRQEMEQWARERQRFLEWIAVYHQLAVETFDRRFRSWAQRLQQRSPHDGAPSAPEPQEEQASPDEDTWVLPPFAPGL